MAIGRESTAANIKPLDGAIVRRYTAGAAIAAGEIVSMSSDGYIDPAIGTGVVLSGGIALQAAASGDRLDVVTYGPVNCVTGGTPAAVAHASDTAGEPAESAGSNAGIVGYVESATVLFVRP